MTQEKTIGIVGGVGPYAGLDLIRKIFDNTIAAKDQDHLTISLISAPSEIEDRSSFLLGSQTPNPGHAIADIILRLEKTGVAVAGIPCNTAHAPNILNAVKSELRKNNCSVELLNIIEEVADYLKAKGFRNVAVLSTSGLSSTNLYPNALKSRGLNSITLDKELQKNVHDSIYNPDYGVKARSNPPSPEAKAILENAIDKLKDYGIDAVVLGCTELPLAFPEKTEHGVAIIDATRILARALIRETAPRKLKAE